MTRRNIMIALGALVAGALALVYAEHEHGRYATDFRRSGERRHDLYGDDAEPLAGGQPTGRL